MKLFCELAEAIIERFNQEMENLQELFSLYLHSNLRTFLNSSDILFEARNHFLHGQANNIQKNQNNVIK